MKKIMTVAAAALCAAVGFADGISSANVVGYKQYDLTGDEFMYTVGVQFKAMTASGDYTIDSKIFDVDAVSGDAIYVFDYQNWDLQSYTFQGYDEKGDSLGWFVVYADSEKSPETIASFNVKSGDNLWLMTSNAASISGEVAASGSQKVTFTVTDEDYMFEFANPYPIDTTFGDLESFCASGDQIYVFDHVNWDLASYAFQGFDGEGASLGWFYVSADTSVEPQTIKDSSAVVLPAGTGAFFMPGGSREWTVSFNY